MRVKLSHLTLHVALPIIIGGLVYVCWRDPGLVMFKWFRALGVEPLVVQLRLATATAGPRLPYWFVYSLPDGVWVYALTAFMAHVWSGSPSSVIKTGWLSLGLLLGAGSELGQLIRFVPGTFDATDFVFYVFAFAIALLVSYALNRKRSLDESTDQKKPALAGGIGRTARVRLWQRVFIQ